MKQLLLVLHKNGITHIRAITFDGASVNLSMVSELRADINSVDDICFFYHPATNEQIVVMPDACHMLKLARNTLADYSILKDKNGGIIEWRFIVELVNVQETEGAHLGTKIRRRHV